MFQYILRYKWTLIGSVAGAIVGFAYYHFFGCTSGCSIKSSPINMTLYGLLMGGLLFNMIETWGQKKK